MTQKPLQTASLHFLNCTSSPQLGPVFSWEYSNMQGIFGVHTGATLANSRFAGFHRQSQMATKSIDKRWDVASTLAFHILTHMCLIILGILGCYSMSSMLNISQFMEGDPQVNTLSECFLPNTVTFQRIDSCDNFKTVTSCYSCQQGNFCSPGIIEMLHDSWRMLDFTW